MEHANATTRQQQHQHQQLQQHHQEQQQQHEHQQQFCLRWHNHQTSLLSTLQVLLEHHTHLTDVTISAEGRTLRAHRVVLSACSTFFLELFRTLDTSQHPIIIIPGASFAVILALLTFMYSGEVNVYEEQIPMLLNLAETLGIKGLADVQNNKTAKCQSADFAEYAAVNKDDLEESSPITTPPTTAAAQTSTPLILTPTPPPTTPMVATVNPILANKLPTPLENFFLKSLQFYPGLLPQPLNFSQTALNKTTELLAKYQQQCNLYQGALSGVAAGKELLTTLSCDDLALSNLKEDSYNAKRLCTGLDKKYSLQQQQQQQQQQLTMQQQKDIKRIDKIVESLRCGNKTSVGSDNTTPNSNTSSHMTQSNAKNSTNCNYVGTITQQQQHTSLTHHHLPIVKPPPIYIPPNPLQHVAGANYAHIDQYAAATTSANRERINITTSDSIDSSTLGASSKTETSPSRVSTLHLPEKMPTSTPASPNTAHAKTPSNSKLYATCFICHKQLSNQYNLRVHLETHQNVRYACNVCTHVSRSKDALRKHVSYRHPGMTPCENEARRKRGAKLLSSNTALSPGISTTAVTANTPPSPTAGPFSFCMNSTQTTTAATTTASPGSSANASSVASIESEAQMAAAAQQLSSAAYMFLPNQFHFAAAAVAQQQQQQKQQMHNVHNIVTNASTVPFVAALSNSTPAYSLDLATNCATTTTTATTNASVTATTTTSTTATNADSSSTTLLGNINVKKENSSPTTDNQITQVGDNTHITAGNGNLVATHSSPST